MRFVGEEWTGDEGRFGLAAALAEALAEARRNPTGVQLTPTSTPAAVCLTDLMIDTVAASKPTGITAPSLPERAPRGPSARTSSPPRCATPARAPSSG